ncbi:MAG: HAD family hydrolase [Bergeyella sp.]|nr:HAD family hydrolase [Bergeyella sp.]
MSQKSTKCFHCGDDITSSEFSSEEKRFCCLGCKSVYEILNSNHLTTFYTLNREAGNRPEENTTAFDYLDTPEIFDKITDFSDGKTAVVNFKIPSIHCSSCIWLLESLRTLNKNIYFSQVNFTRKTLQISFSQENIQLSDLAKFLTKLGYKPVISLETSEKKDDPADRGLLIKLAVAGFAFGNGMFFSFPEYIGGNDIWIESYKNLFRGIMFLLASAVLFFSASDYFRSALYALKNKVINIEVPITIGIVVLYGRSTYEIYTDKGPGYFDTLCGLLFFMLLGKIFQKKTYSSLSYERDYKSFYPIAVTRVEKNKTHKNILLSEIKVGDRIWVRNQEIIPVDAVLIEGEGNIDNSFITGESVKVEKKTGDKIYAGGKQVGKAIELEVVKNVDQSYLTQLWNKEAFKKKERGFDSITNKVSKYFTYVILFITLLSGIYWYDRDTEKMYQVISAVLIVACPCALALSAPFTLGHMMRIFGKHKCYVKDTLTIEKLSKIDTLVFDKTGTITVNRTQNICYEGKKLAKNDLICLKDITKNSNHPLSKLLYHFLSGEVGGSKSDKKVNLYKEFLGKGILATIGENTYRLGSASFVGRTEKKTETMVHLQKNNRYLGKFIIRNDYRKGVDIMFASLEKYTLYILSGDNSSEEETLRKMAPQISDFRFNQSPEDKLNFILQLQEQNKKVAMLGDGLNDAGALKQSDVGFAIADNANTFTPASDIIISGDALPHIAHFLVLSKSAIKLVKAMFVISFLYNTIGLGYAVTGNLSPLTAAILMPASSISVVIFSTISTKFISKFFFKKKSI